jgi:uncharacterized integral membrane protein
MHLFKTVTLLLFSGIVIIFIVQNLGLIILKFIVWEAEVSLSFVSLSFYLLGALSGGLVFSMLRTLSTTKRPVSKKLE